MEKLFIISNESVYENDKKFFCDNIDLKSTPEGLSGSFEVNLIARRSKKIRNHFINLDKIKIYSSFISFISAVIKSTKNNNSKYLLISLSPYTFFACIILWLLKKKPLVYLRSNGFDEYKIIFGHFGVLIYSIMFSITAKLSVLISCRKYILKGKNGYVVNPSQLDSEWKLNQSKPNLERINLLYVGRMRKEKGIFSLINIIQNNNDINLTIVGEENDSSNRLKHEKIKTIKIVHDQKKLIKLYDDNNIFILPSYTEGQPMALMEALSRLRPSIVFKEIEHVVQNRIGVFISDRNYESLIKTINHIIKNYVSIQESMRKNYLPTNKDFIKSVKNIILEK